MKQLTEKRKRTAPNAWGHDSTVYYQYFELEESDVGTVLHNWGGYRYKDLKVAKRDVGKIIEIMTEYPNGPWTCLGFTNFTKEQIVNHG